MKRFCFTIDDNIRFLKELTERNCASIFNHPYVALLKRLHERFDLKIQLNLFYRMDGFDLSQMSDRHASEWTAISDWLKFSFHSDREISVPYENSGYEEVLTDCRSVNEQVLRFAGPASLAETTTIHCCMTTEEGLKALADNGVRGLLGLYGSDEKPRVSYGLNENYVRMLRNGHFVCHGGITFAPIDMVLNLFPIQDLLPALSKFFTRDSIRVMIHEQFFYEDYIYFEYPDFEEKLTTVFDALCKHGYQSCFFEELI